VESQPEVGEIERLVLTRLRPEGTTTATIAEQLGRPTGTVDAAVSRLAQAGLAEVTDGVVALTQLGRLVAEGIREAEPPKTAAAQVTTVDLAGIAKSIGSSWEAHTRQRATRERAARADVLASDADRDTAVQSLSEAFSEGRLSSNEFEERTSEALAARTHGQLDDVLRDLGGLRRPVRSHPVRRAVFWVLAFLSSPFVLLGALFLAFGVDSGDRVGGMVFLILLLPGLLKLRRWAWPRG
jgi:hypothetical protein